MASLLSPISSSLRIHSVHNPTSHAFFLNQNGSSRFHSRSSIECVPSNPNKKVLIEHFGSDFRCRYSKLTEKSSPSFYSQNHLTSYANSNSLFRNGIDVQNNSFAHPSSSKNHPRLISTCAAKNDNSENFENKTNSWTKTLFKIIVSRVLPMIAFSLLLSSFKPSFASAHSSTAVNTSHLHVAGGETTKASELINSAWTGLAAGWLHTLSGPDHLAALAPLSIGRSRLESAAVGALWGCGHDAGQILFGLIFLLFKDRLHLDLLRTWSSRVVGITLLIIGGMGLKEAQHTPIQCAPDDKNCLAQPGAVAVEVNQGKFGLTTFATGIVHGLQPDALLVILPALALPSKLAGASFLAMFLLGTIVAMGSYTAFIGSCSRALHERVPWLTQRLSMVASSVAILVGVFIIAGDYMGRKLF